MSKFYSQLAPRSSKPTALLITVVVAAVPGIAGMSLKVVKGFLFYN